MIRTLRKRAIVGRDGLGCVAGCALFLAVPRVLAQGGSVAAGGAPTSVAETGDDLQEASNRLEWRRLGPFDFQPRFTAQVIYDDNISIQSQERLDDVIWVASPEVTFILGDKQGGTGRTLTLSYVPSILIFTEHDEYDNVDHSVSASGLWPFARLTLGFSQSYNNSSGSLTDVGNRVNRDAYNTRLTSRYDFGEKLSGEVNGGLAITDFLEEGYNNSTEWRNDNWFNYRISAKVTTGAGLTLGFLDADGFPNQTFEQLLARATYNLTAKIDATASAGGEWRQYDEGGGTEFAPVFTVAGSYWPVDGTSLTIEGHRRNQNSAAFTGQNFISTGISLGVRQRFADRFFAGLSAGYDNADYRSAAAGVSADRSDDIFNIRVTLDTTITQRWSAGFFYTYRDNNSRGTGGLPFTENQVGLQTSYVF